MSRPKEGSRQVSERAAVEASTWVVWLHGPDRDAAMVSGWRKWLAEHPDHPLAWESASDAWNEIHGVPPSVLGMASAPTATDVPPRTLRHLLIATCAGTLLIIVGWCLHGFLNRSELTTDIGEQKVVNLPDGTRVELNTHSRLQPRYESDVRRVVLESGEAHFSVAHERRPFVVIAGGHKVIALGTEFIVRRADSAHDAMTVTLLEGRVAVAPDNASDKLPAKSLPEVTLLAAGQRLQVHDGAAPVVDRPSLERATGWLRGEVVFDHTELRDAVAEMNRYNTVRITVAESVAHYHVGGAFRAGDSEAFARAVAGNYNLSLVQHTDQIDLQPR